MFKNWATISLQRQRVIVRIPHNDKLGFLRPSWVCQAEAEYAHFTVVNGEWPEDIRINGQILQSDRIAITPL